MKAKLYSSDGKSKGTIDLPLIFNTKPRQDIVQKYFEAEKYILMQPYSHDPKAGRKHSASGTISHKRHTWKGHYGKGISRIPRKTMWRRGTQFYWIGAEVSSTRGGRRVHGPQLVKKLRKTNKKEISLAFNSALAATASPFHIIKRYASIKNLESAPFVIESLPEKTKALIQSLKNIFGDNFSVVLQKKSVRPGKGKLRGRKYKSTSGLLVLKSPSEKIKSTGLDIKNITEISISNLYPLGRLTLFTKKALESLDKKQKVDSKETKK